MQFRTSHSIICLAVLALAGCAAADQPSMSAPASASAAPREAPVPVTDMEPPTDNPLATQDQSMAGWYMERAGQGLFQSCGDSTQLLVSGATEALRSKAGDFGLEENTPVYVRVSGTPSARGEAIQVSQVEQFGSDTPVRDCGLTGVVIPAPVPN